ncbi:MAG: serpin family protein [Armatimonas sp.]
MSELSAAKASDTFGRTLMQALAKEEPGKNLFVSPLSLFITLAMTANGAALETRRSLLMGMNLPDNLKVSNAACSELLQALTQPETGIEMGLANALWAFAPHRFLPAVRARIQESFGAELRDVKWQTAAPEINSWAADKTRQMVKDVVTPRDFNYLTAFALSNAAYFKGLWTTPFDPKYTRPMPFQSRGSAPRMVPMMQAAMPVECAFGPKFDAIRLPYGKGRFQLYAFLPAPDQTPEGLLPDLPLFQDSWRRTLSSVRIRLAFPKLMLDLPRLELMPTLSKLSLLGNNDLTPMENEEKKGMLEIAKVFHKTKLEIDEAGTRAAAATVVVIQGRGGGGPRPVYFNRPFVLSLVDEKSQTSLFTGVIYDP